MFEEVEIGSSRVWINRGQRTASNPSRELANRTRAPSKERRLQTCNSRLKHFGEVRHQSLVPATPDSLFPADGTSIGPQGSNCGDTARGLFEDCEKYNHWTTFRTLARKTGKAFQVISPNGPNWHDIGQGELGTCYFLAALASIAYTDPSVIESMFVHREKWASNIYTTRWMISGEVSLVEVNYNIPGDDYRPFFVQPSHTGEWWPVILEKAWSKIASSYVAAEGGWWTGPVWAITMAPIRRCTHGDYSQEQLLQEMKEATAMGWPMGAGTGPSCRRFGLTSGHAYSVFRVFTMEPYGSVVQVYNPWNSDGYNGTVPNKNKDDGAFTMTASEYFNAFEDTAIAKVHDDYQVSSKRIQTLQSAVTAWDFEVSFQWTFYVSLTWPSDRMVEPCDRKHPRVTLAVLKNGTQEQVVAPPVQVGVDAASASVALGPGNYTVVAAVSFLDENVASEVNLVVYAPETVHISASSNDPLDALMRAVGPANRGEPCSTVFIAGQGNFALKKHKLVDGVPTYWSSSGSDFVYWYAHRKQWLSVGAKYMEKVQSGEVWSFEKHTAESMTCGCHDDPKGVAGFSDVHCNMVSNSAPTYTNVMCEGSEHSGLVQQFCPVTCGSSYCKGSSAESLGEPPQKEKPTPPAQQTCQDSSPTHIKLAGKMATCAELVQFCHDQETSFVAEKCCETCAEVAEGGGVSNEPTCKDHAPPGISDGRGHSFATCSELKGYCDHPSVQERCCETCEAVVQESGKLEDECVDAALPNLRTWFGSRHTCSFWKSFCEDEKVREECCKTCSQSAR